MSADSLVERWLKKSQVTETGDKPDDLPGETVIKRGTVVSAKVVVGRGVSNVKVLEQYRVVDIHDKYCISDSCPRSHATRYNLKVRMQEVSVVKEY